MRKLGNLLIVMAVAFLSWLALPAQQKINPTTQIKWPLITGSGAPTSSCTSANYGQPYIDLLTNTGWVCGTTGWAIVGGAGSGPGKAFTVYLSQGATGITACPASGALFSDTGTASDSCIQTALDTVESTYGGGTIVVDGAYLMNCGKVNTTNPISGTTQYFGLQVHSHETLLSIHGAGFFLHASSNCIMAGNDPTGDPAATKEFGVRIIGGTWNQNRANQSKFEQGSSANGWNFGFWLDGCESCEISETTLVDPVTFGYVYGNFLNIGGHHNTFLCTAAAGCPGASNTDMLHVVGPGNGGNFSDFYDTNGSDDCTAFNTDEFVGSYNAGVITPFFGYTRYSHSGGDLSNIYTERIKCNQVYGSAVRRYGIVTANGVATMGANGPNVYNSFTNPNQATNADTNGVGINESGLTAGGTAIVGDWNAGPLAFTGVTTSVVTGNATTPYPGPIQTLSFIFNYGGSNAYCTATSPSGLPSYQSSSYPAGTQPGSTGTLTFPYLSGTGNGGTVTCVDHLSNILFGQLPSSGTSPQTLTMNNSTFFTSPLVGVVLNNTGTMTSSNGSNSLLPYTLNFTTTYGGSLIYCSAYSSIAVPTFSAGVLTMPGSGSRNGGTFTCTDVFGNSWFESVQSTGGSAQTVTMSAFPQTSGFELTAGGVIGGGNGASALVTGYLNFSSTYGGSPIFCTATSPNGQPSYSSGTLTLPTLSSHNNGTLDCMAPNGGRFIGTIPTNGTPGSPQTITMSSFTSTGSYINVTGAAGNWAIPGIASGTSALGTSAISATSCASVVTTSATGAASTNSISWAFNAAPGTAYTSGLTILPYVTTNNVNFLVCNPTAGSLTPAAATLNWKVW